MTPHQVQGAKQTASFNKITQSGMSGYKRNGLHTQALDFQISSAFKEPFFSTFLLSKQNQVPHIFVNRCRVIYHIKALVVVIRTLLSFLTKNFRTISSVENNGLTIVKYAYSTLIIELSLFLVFLSDHFIANKKPYNSQIKLCFFWVAT